MRWGVGTTLVERHCLRIGNSRGAMIAAYVESKHVLLSSPMVQNPQKGSYRWKQAEAQANATENHFA